MSSRPAWLCDETLSQEKKNEAHINLLNGLEEIETALTTGLRRLVFIDSLTYT